MAPRTFEEISGPNPGMLRRYVYSGNSRQASSILSSTDLMLWRSCFKLSTMTCASKKGLSMVTDGSTAALQILPPCGPWIAHCARRDGTAEVIVFHASDLRRIEAFPHYCQGFRGTIVLVQLGKYCARSWLRMHALKPCSRFFSRRLSALSIRTFRSVIRGYS